MIEQVFLQVFSQSKIFSGAFGASQFRPKNFFGAFGASNNSGSPEGGSPLQPPPPPLSKTLGRTGASIPGIPSAGPNHRKKWIFVDNKRRKWRCQIPWVQKARRPLLPLF